MTSDSVRSDSTAIHELEGRIAREIYARLTAVIDPELGRSITDLGMVTGVEVSACEDSDDAFTVKISLELTVPGCPLSDVIRQRIESAVETYPDATLELDLNVGSMGEEKLGNLVAQLRAARRENPFHKAGARTRIFAVASGKGGVGKSSVTANLAAAAAAMGYSTAVIDADIYGFSIPGLFGATANPTNLNGMLMPVDAWGVKLMSIGMFAGADQAILWRGPRLQRSLEQFLSDVWWGDPDVLFIDMAPGTGDMAISVAQALPNAELIVVTTPQPSASDIAVRAGLVALQLPMGVAGVIENMSWFEHNGEKLRIFGEGGGQRVAQQLSQQLEDKLGHDVPLLAQLPLEPDVRESGEIKGRPAVLNSEGTLADSALAREFEHIIEKLMK